MGDSIRYLPQTPLVKMRPGLHAHLFFTQIELSKHSESEVQKSS